METELNLNELHLSLLEEEFLLSLEHNTTTDSLYNFKYKPVTISKIIYTLKHKGLIDNDKITQKGEKMIHYLHFRNDTLNSFLIRSNLNSKIYFNKLKDIDINILIAIKNLLSN